jgi:hypothetical protein
MVDPFIVMDVLAAANVRAAAGADVLHMEIGKPGSTPPQAVLTAAREALGQVPLGYTEALGRPQLRAAIANHYDQLYGLAVDPGQVVVTVGTHARGHGREAPRRLAAPALVVLTYEAAPPAPARGLAGTPVDHGGRRHA